jgi:putative Mn2+ efflux pump MntP
MILLTAILIILAEAIGEGFLKRFNKASWLFGGFIQWLIAIFLFGVWFVIAYNFDNYYVETWKLITGFVFVRFGIFDVAYNLSNGQKWNYYGTTKLYDRLMDRLGGFGIFAKVVCLIVGVCFLLGLG